MPVSAARVGCRCRRLAAAFLVVFLAAVFFAAAFLTGASPSAAAAFLAGAFLAAAFLAGAFFAAAFLAGLQQARGRALRSRPECRRTCVGAPQPAPHGDWRVIRRGPCHGPSEKACQAATPCAVCVAGSVCRTYRGRRAPALVAVTDLPGRVAGWLRLGFPLRERRRVDSRRPWRVSHTTPLEGGSSAGQAGCSGSPTSPVSGSSGPWTRRVSRGTPPGSRPATAAMPASTSSGRTAGTSCRSTSSRLTVGGVAPVTRERDHRRAGIEVAQTLLGHPLHAHRLRGQEPGHVGPHLVLGPRHVQAPAAGLEEVREAATGRHDDLDDVQAVRQRLGERGMDVRGVDHLRERELEVLRLAGGPRRRGTGVRDPRVRVEAGRVGHRHPGAEHRPLERAAEVAVAGEPEAAALGVADPQPLHRGCLLLGLLSRHGSSLIASEG